MNIKSQVCSFLLAVQLKKLNCKQESLWWWIPVDIDSPEWTITPKKSAFQGRFYSAFTVAELGEMLKETHIDIDYWYSYPDFRLKLAESDTSDARNEKEAEARGEMVAYLLENGLTPKK